MVRPSRFDVLLVRLDPIRGSEIRKTRPCAVISPDEMNHALRTTIVAPMTTGGHAYPWRVPVRFSRKDGWIALDQMRTVDRERLDRKLGVLPDETAAELLQRLAEMFAP